MSILVGQPIYQHFQKHKIYCINNPKAKRLLHGRKRNGYKGIITIFLVKNPFIELCRIKLNDSFTGLVANSQKVVYSLKYVTTYYINAQVLHLYFNIFTSFVLNVDEVTLRKENKEHKYSLFR